mgnify:CR=1 FL=1
MTDTIIASSISILNLTGYLSELAGHEAEANVVDTAGLGTDAGAMGENVHNITEIEQQAAVGVNGKRGCGDFVTVVWRSGTGILLLWMLYVNIRFQRELVRKRVYFTEKEGIPVYLAGRETGIYIPTQVQENSLLMEHYKHKDLWHSYLRCFLLAVYWFHPLVWIAVHTVRRDCELACDEAVIKILGDDKRESYGNSLLTLLERSAGTDSIINAATTMAGKGIKEWITAIAVKHERKTGVILVMVLLLIAITIMTFTQEEKGAKAGNILFMRASKEMGK